MSDFVIPKNKDFTFTLKVMERDSFLAQDLTNMSTASMVVFNTETQADTTAVTTLVVVDALNGVLKGTMIASETDKLDVARGPKEDGYYLKSLYQASVEVTFSDSTLPIFVTIDKVYVAPTGA